MSLANRQYFAKARDGDFMGDGWYDIWGGHAHVCPTEGGFLLRQLGLSHGPSFYMAHRVRITKGRGVPEP
jgi:hypothetical protein